MSIRKSAQRRRHDRGHVEYNIFRVIGDPIAGQTAKFFVKRFRDGVELSVEVSFAYVQHSKRGRTEYEGLWENQRIYGWLEKGAISKSWTGTMNVPH